jgi:hypothetical protein
LSALTGGVTSLGGMMPRLTSISRSRAFARARLGKGRAEALAGETNQRRRRVGRERTTHPRTRRGARQTAWTAVARARCVVRSEPTPDDEVSDRNLKDLIRARLPN